MKRSGPIKRKQPMARGSSSLKRTPMKRVGKRMLAWAAVWRKLKPAFEKAGIKSCEIRYPGCWRDQCLTPPLNLPLL